MSSKAQKKAKKKAAKAKSDIFAVPGVPHRYACGKLVVSEPEYAGPTPETLARLAEIGPTDMIQRLLVQERIGNDQARALEAFAMIRRIIGVAEAGYKPMTDTLLTGGGGHANPDVMEWAKREYRNAVEEMDYYEIDACISITDNRPPRNVKHVQTGSKKLAAIWIRGDAKIGKRAA